MHSIRRFRDRYKYCSLRSISFKNFRKFSDFPEMSLGGLNIFVGQNNSGKSTAIKAMLLALLNAEDTSFMDDEFLGLGEVPKSFFSYVNTLDAHTHLGDLWQNMHDNQNSQSFSIGIGDSIMSFELRRIIKDKNHSCLSAPFSKFVFDFPKYHATISYGEKFVFTFSLAGFRLFFRHRLDSDCLMALMDDLQDRSKDEMITVSWDFRFVDEEHLEGLVLSSQGKKGLMFFLRELRMKADFDFHSFQVEFIEAHSASHNEFLSEGDKNNYLAQTVAKYSATPYSQYSKEAHLFVLKWLSNLRIGKDFKVTRPFSELLKVDIQDMSGAWRSLGSLGTGSIQLFILLLRVAIAIQGLKRVIIFVEEPEQNLHPALQSLLAEMFMDAIEISGNNIQFVVETHSEYLVRRTQVIVSRMIQSGSRDIETINNVFKVYYFPENDIPYSMEYRNTGQFEHQFGPGFFDEAGKNYRALLEQNLLKCSTDA